MELYIGCGTLKLDDCGKVIALTARDGADLLPAGIPPQPLIQLGLNGALTAPDSCKKEGDAFFFTFSGGASAVLKAEEKEGYAVLTAEKAPEDAGALVFGPLFTGLTEVIGDIIGVVQGGKWAVGVQALNAKTLGGFPAEYRDSRSPFVGEGPVSELSVAPMLYFDSAAFAGKSDAGECSLLQLFCENRRRPRMKEIMGYEGQSVRVGPMADCPDARIEGASMALFCCPREEALPMIGRIEEAEGLPHPMLDGQWAKLSRESMRSYLIAEFNPENFDMLLESAKKAGFQNLYHPEPFAAWGHFELRRDCFPDGDASLADYCARAAEKGMRIGLHTLSNFTTTNDAYVTPVPDSRLVTMGQSPLKADISETAEEIAVEDGALYRLITSLQTVRIGDELIRYAEEKDGVLTGCQRGAWGTSPAVHPAGEPVKLLADHPYRVFFPNLELQQEYSRRIGSLFAKTGAAQISFDGLEGCAAAGEDAYSINRFCLDTWEGWGRPDVINDASRLNHNLWHMHTRMNWGEPWGAKMREGMIEYRVKNQDFYRRNLFPRMLGWFLIRKADRKFEATPPEDIEWALSMAAGFDAGFALSTSAAVLTQNGCAEELLETIRNWEELRLAGAFPEELRESLRSPATEWHLEKGEDAFCLYPLFLSKPYVCDLLELQPGQPGGADWVLQNPHAAQPYDLRVRVEGNGQIHDPAFITRKGILRFPCTVKGSQYLWYRNGRAYITDRNYRVLEEVKPAGQGIAESGQQPFSFSCGFSGEEGPEVTVRVFTKGEPVRIPFPEDR